MKTIQYSDILKRALLMTWQNKFLWVFGLGIFLGSLVSNVGANSNTADVPMAMNDFLQSHWFLSLAIGVAFILTVFGLFLLRIAGIAGIIKSANNIVVYRQSTLAAIFSEIKKYVWQLFWLELLVNIVLGVIVVVLIIPVAYLFMLKADILASIVLMVAILILVSLIALAYFLRRYAYFYIILGNMKTKMALESAYALFGKNIRESLLMGCAAIVADLAILAIIFVCTVLLIVMAVSLGALYHLITKADATVVLNIWLILAAAVLLVVFSWYASFGQTAWTLFFQEISLEKQKEKTLVEKMESAEEIPSPEAVLE